MPSTGIPVVDVVLQVVGALYFLFSAVGHAPGLKDTKAGDLARTLALNLKKPAS